MGEKKQKNAAFRLVRHVGSGAVILSVLILIKTAGRYKIDTVILCSGKNIFYLILILFLYIMLVVFGGIPWMRIVNALTGRQIRYSEMVFIYVRSNLLKYIPGNVFNMLGGMNWHWLKG